VKLGVGVLLLALVAPAVACDQQCELTTALAKWTEGEKLAAKSILERLSREGNVSAQLFLGEFYVVEEGNLEEGRRLFTPLAHAGNARAQRSLATSYLGQGSKESDREGVRWLKLAAAQREPTALELLAQAYRRGWWGLPQDQQEAARLEKELAHLPK
jgi:TPR repeat protein